MLKIVLFKPCNWGAWTLTLIESDKFNPGRWLKHQPSTDGKNGGARKEAERI